MGGDFSDAPWNRQDDSEVETSRDTSSLDSAMSRNVSQSVDSEEEAPPDFNWTQKVGTSAMKTMTAVRGYVKSVLDAVDREKMKRLKEKEMRAQTRGLEDEHKSEQDRHEKEEPPDEHPHIDRSRNVPPNVEEEDHPEFNWSRNVPPRVEEDEHPEFDWNRNAPSIVELEKHSTFDWNRNVPPSFDEILFPVHLLRTSSGFNDSVLSGASDSPDDHSNLESSPRAPIKFMILPNDDEMQDLHQGSPEGAPNLEPPMDCRNEKTDADSDEVEKDIDTLQWVAPDFTAIPKVLDARIEQLDTDNALRSTIIKRGPEWQWQQSDLLTETSTTNWSLDDMEKAKKSAIDLLDAISCSGALPIECSEVHVVIGLSHCFENDLMYVNCSV